MNYGESSNSSHKRPFPFNYNTQLLELFSPYHGSQGSPLHNALSMDGSGETVRALLEVGADPNSVNSVGNTVMHEAVQQFMRGVLNELCQSRKVDYKMQNKDGFNPLHLAAHLGNIAAVQIILYYQPDVINLKDRNGNTALHLAALSKEKQVLEVLVAKKDLAHDVENDSGETALDLVIKGVSNANTSSCFQILMSLYPNPNIIDFNGNTLIHKAITAHNLDILIELIGLNIDLAIQNRKGLNSLHLAVLSDNILITKEILKCAKHLVNIATKEGHTPLHLAISNTTLIPFATDIESCTELLLSCGANPNAMDEEGNTPLHEAAKQQNSAAFLLLTQCPKIDYRLKNSQGLNALHLAAFLGITFPFEILSNNVEGLVDEKAGNGYTALHIAASEGHHNVVERLIQYGKAEINVRNVRNETPLHLVVRNALNTSSKICIETILSAEADINAVDSEGNTPLHEAVQNTKYDVLETLCKYPDLNYSIINNNGFNVLHWAVFHGNANSTKTLLHYAKEKVDVKKIDGFWAIHVAALNGHKEVVEVLLENGKADIDLANNMGFTPLHLAVIGGHCGVIELLVNSKCNLNVKDKYGNSALHLILLHRYHIKTVINQMESPLIYSIYQALPQVPDCRLAIAVACYFVKIGMDLDAVNSKHQSVLDCLENKELQDIVQSYKLETCGMCGDSSVRFLITLKPCEHKFACEYCVKGMKKCVRCSCDVERRVAPDGRIIPYESKNTAAMKIKELESKIAELEEMNLCAICMENRKEVHFKPCCHGSCAKCSECITRCHMCRKWIEGKEPIY